MRVANAAFIPFTGKYVYLTPSSKSGMDAEELYKENIQAKKASKFGIDVPVYNSAYDNNGNILRMQYETIGDPADPKSNPISKKHLKNLFKNLYNLDRAGIYHNNLDPSHIFFAEGGGVEIDCFRHSLNFVKKPNGILCGNNGSIIVHDYAMPSNKSDFEEQFLGSYISKIKNNGEQHAFITNYLKEAAYYHQKRAEMLTNRGFSTSDKTVQIELLQNKAFKNPSDEIINFTKEKLEFLKQKRFALTEWDKGNGICGRPVDPMRRFNAIDIYLDCIKTGLDLRNKTIDLSQSTNSDEKEYFEFELKNINMFLENLYNNTKDMGELNFKDNINDIYLSGNEEMNVFLEFYSEIDINGSYKQCIDNIEKTKKYYADLAYDWFLSCESNWQKAQKEKQ